MSIRSLLLPLLLISWHIGSSQPPDPKADSLIAIWNDPSRPDTSRIKAMNKALRRIFTSITPDSVLHIGDRMVDFAREKGLEDWMNTALTVRGNGHLLKSDLERALADFELALEIAENRGDTVDMIAPLNGMSTTSVTMGNRVMAIKYLMKALRIAEAKNDSGMVMTTLSNLAVSHDLQGDLAAATTYYVRAMAMSKALKDEGVELILMYNLAGVRERSGDRPSALGTFEECLRMAERTGNERVVITCCVEVGSRRSVLGQYDTALHYFDRALPRALAMGDSSLVARVELELGRTFHQQGLYRKALPHAERAVRIARRTDDLAVLRDAAMVAYEVRRSLGDAQGALAMHELYYVMRDSLKNDESKQAVIEQRFQYDFEKKEALLHAEQEKKDALMRSEQEKKDLRQRNIRNSLLIGLTLMIAFAGVFLFQRNRISKEKARSEELLLNILPEEVAEELKAKGSAEAVHIDHVTVLFTDFKGFTAMSETMSPQELVRDLNECFSAFDRITGKYGIEKIKTIGDAYMAAGGLPTPNTTHATDVIKAAFEMRDFIAEGKARKIAADQPFFEIRIGIHTGPVVAGIVGVKKFQYDIWGDTVNTASRMESSGEVGQVNISESTYALVKDVEESSQLSVVGSQGASLATDNSELTTANSELTTRKAFTFTSRGKVQAKGKGEMEMYFVRRSSEAAQA